VRYEFEDLSDMQVDCVSDTLIFLSRRVAIALVTSFVRIHFMICDLDSNAYLFERLSMRDVLLSKLICLCIMKSEGCTNSASYHIL
jgi:hypothetical protein